MAQAQFGGPLLVLRKDVCTACYIVYDLTERPPKLLQCGHVFCLLCLHCMKRDEVILCFICEYPTPSPRDLSWLPTNTDSSLIWRIPDTTPLAHGTAELRRFPDHSVVRPDTAHRTQDNPKNASNFASNNAVQIVNTGGVHQANGSIPSSSDPAADGQNTGTGMSFGPGRELLCGLVLPHHGVRNVLWNCPANSVNGSDDLCREPSDPSYAYSTAESSQNSPQGETEGVFFGTLETPSSNAHANPVQVSQILQEFADLIEKLKTASRNCSDDRWVFMWYLQEEATLIHRKLLELKLNPLGTPSAPGNSDSLSPHLGLDIIGHITQFLEKTRRGENNSTDENFIFELCAFLMCQRFKTFLVEKSRIGQSSAVAIPASIQEDMPIKIFCLNGNFAVIFRSADGVQTHTVKLNIPTLSKASETEDLEREIPEKRETEKKVENGRNSIANLNQPERKVKNSPYITMKDMSNMYYLDFKIDGRPAGRVIVETHPSLTPLMSANFAVLCSGTRGKSYRGCKVFQTWYGQSIITGDTETNTGNGGRSVLNDEFFVPDETAFPAERGAVGMRRLARNPAPQKGKVSSQFRILLNNQPRITGIFGHVASGIEVVDKISHLDDGNGNPRKRVLISECGKFDF